MARKEIRESDAKRMLATALTGYEGKVVLVSPGEKLQDKVNAHPWLRTEKLVAKPDQLFGKRGKNKLISLDKDLEGTQAWIDSLVNTEKTLLSGVKGTLTHFIVEPFTPFEADQAEYYVSLTLDVDGDRMFLSNRGGVDIEENWEHVKEIIIDPMKGLDRDALKNKLVEMFPDKHREPVFRFLTELYGHFCNGGYTFLEINPFIVVKDRVQPLDTKAKLDDTAEFECRSLWGEIEYPAPFGQKLTPEEEYVRELDSKTGASLKLRVLNPKGRIWNMVAGGGASVIYADTVCDLGQAQELAMYGEYSGNPDTTNTYQYAKTVISLLTKEPDAMGRPKLLLIGGGIANFTDVAKTFTGIIMAIEEYAEKLKNVKARIYVRRAGPNYKEGLAKMKRACEKLGIPIEVHGPETHMTQIVADALRA